jgi:hypothetical protein
MKEGRKEENRALELDNQDRKFELDKKCFEWTLEESDNLINSLYPRC